MDSWTTCTCYYLVLSYYGFNTQGLLWRLWCFWLDYRCTRSGYLFWVSTVNSNYLIFVKCLVKCRLQMQLSCSNWLELLKDFKIKIDQQSDQQTNKINCKNCLNLKKMCENSELVDRSRWQDIATINQSILLYIYAFCTWYVMNIGIQK